MRALGFIIMELMQKYTKDDGAIGVDDLRRWPSKSDAIGFLLETTSTASASELIKVSCGTSLEPITLTFPASIIEMSFAEGKAQGDHILSSSLCTPTL
jgi:hypothetical protein